MIWFKHYADARNSTTMKAIIKKLGMTGYAQAMCLLEMCAAKWDQKEDGWAECQFRFHVDYLCQELRMKPKRSRNVLGTFQECSLILVSHNDDKVVVTVPKLLEYFDKHTKHNRTRVVSKPVAGRLDKNRIDNEEEAAPQISIAPNQSSCVKSDVRFSKQKEIREIVGYLKTLFNGPVPLKILQRIPDFLIACDGDEKKVHKILEDLYQNPKIQTGEGLAGSKSAYVSKCIMSEFGLE